MYLAYDVQPYSLSGLGYAKTIVSDYSGTRLQKKTNNGSSLPAPGDIIAMNGTSYYPSGHTAIVTAVNVDNAGNGTITVLEQNWGMDSNGSRNISVANKTVGGNVTGWLHDPLASNDLFTISAIGLDQTAYVKESVGGPWINVMNNASQVEMSGDRIVVLGADGVVWAKEGNISSPWINMFTGATQVAVAGNRIAVRGSGGALYAKHGAIDTAWVTVRSSNVANFDITDTRVGIVTTSGDALIKEGSLTTAWVTLMNGTSRIDTSGNRIGVLGLGGALYAKESAVGDPWVLVRSSNVVDFTLTNTRVGIVTNTGAALVKEGTLTTAWVTLLGGIAKIDSSGNKIAVLDTVGVLYAKEGPIDAAWMTLLNGVEGMSLAR